MVQLVFNPTIEIPVSDKTSVENLIIRSDEQFDMSCLKPFKWVKKLTIHVGKDISSCRVNLPYLEELEASYITNFPNTSNLRVISLSYMTINESSANFILSNHGF